MLNYLGDMKFGLNALLLIRFYVPLDQLADQGLLFTPVWRFALIYGHHS